MAIYRADSNSDRPRGVCFQDFRDVACFSIQRVAESELELLTTSAPVRKQSAAAPTCYEIGAWAKDSGTE